MIALSLLLKILKALVPLPDGDIDADNADAARRLGDQREELRRIDAREERVRKNVRKTAALVRERTQFGVSGLTREKFMDAVFLGEIEDREEDDEKGDKEA